MAWKERMVQVSPFCGWRNHRSNTEHIIELYFILSTVQILQIAAYCIVVRLICMSGSHSLKPRVKIARCVLLSACRILVETEERRSIRVPRAYAQPSPKTSL